MAIDPLAAKSAASIPAARPPVVHPDAAAGGDAKASAAAGGAKPAGSDDQEMSFWDVLDIVNPLQHIPIVGSVYRAITGDEIKPAMQIGGDILYGGVIGGITSIANAVLQEATGKDLGGHVMAQLGFGDDGAKPGAASPAAVQVAANASATPAPPPAQAANKPQSSARPTASAVPPASGPSPAPGPAPGPSAAEVIAALQGGGAPMGGQQMGAQMAGAPMGAPAGGGISGGLAAAARQQPQGLDPNAVMNSGYTPNKMPKRDAMLASAMPRGSQASNLERAAAVDRTGPVLPPMRNAPAAAASSAAATAAAPGSAAGAGPATQAATTQAAPHPAVGVGNIAPSREMMGDVMMRNLAKYQAAKQAQHHTVRTSG